MLRVCSVVSVVGWRALTFCSTRWGWCGRCPARGFQHQLHHPAPRSHLGTACCTAGSGPGPPPCRAPSSDGLSGCAVARFRLRACRPQQTCLGQGSWTPGAGKRAFLGFTGSPQQLRSGHGQEGIDGRTVGDWEAQRVNQPPLQLARGHRPSIQACSCSGQHTTGCKSHLGPARRSAHGE